jgi:hypothetical protein
MNEGLIFVAAILTLARAILAALYGLVRGAPPQPQRQSYRRFSMAECMTILGRQKRALTAREGRSLDAGYLVPVHKLSQNA